MSLYNNRYEKILKIGQGSFGNVYVTLDKKNKEIINENNYINEEKKSNEKDLQYEFVAVKKMRTNSVNLMNIKYKYNHFKSLNENLIFSILLLILI